MQTTAKATSELRIDPEFASLACPYRLAIVGLVRHAGRKLEAKLHRRCRTQRLHGEWFTADEGLIRWIRGHAEVCQ